jgi:glycosyltransferase involved in cell wall biosynthesis
MRIVLATETFLPHVDGIVTRLTHTLTNLQRCGDELLIIAPGRRDSPASFGNAPVLTVPSMSAARFYPDVKLAWPFSTPKVERAITDFNPDLIHVVAPAFLGFGAIFSAWRRKVPLIASYHVQYAKYMESYRLGFIVPFVWWYLRQVHNRAALNLATSLPMVRLLRTHGIKNVDLWPPGVDADLFAPAKRAEAMRRRLTGGHPEEFLIVCVARLGVEKELHRLVPVMREISGARLALVGDGPARKQLEADFAGLPVVFAGMLKGEELAAAYASGDIYVLPSSTETLGLTALEAMSAGVPAIAANRGGLPDLVLDGQTGYLFDPDRPADLLERVVALKENDQLRQSMAAAAREHAERFSWMQTTQQLRQYYDRVLAHEIAPGNLAHQPHP